MTTNNPDLPASIDEREFSTSRKGYNKREVRTFLSELEANFRSIEKWTHDARLRLQQAELDARKARDAEVQSVDAAIEAVLESRDRIIDRARKQATEIEEGARSKADAVLDGVGVRGREFPLDLDAARREAAAIIEDAQHRAIEMRLEADVAERRLEELTVERNRVRDEIESLIAETRITESEKGAEIDPDGTLRRVEEQAKLILADAEAAAASIKAGADLRGVSGEIEVGEARAQAKKIIEEAEERVQDMLLMAEAASEQSVQNAEEQATKRIEYLVSQTRKGIDADQEAAALEVEALIEEARSMRDRAKVDSEDVKRRALSILDDAEAAASSRLAEVSLLEEEVESLHAVAIDTLKTAQDGAEALRVEAQELREEANRKKNEAETSRTEAVREADHIRGEAEDAARILTDEAKRSRSEAEAEIEQLLIDAEQIKAAAASKAAVVTAESRQMTVEAKKPVARAEFERDATRVATTEEVLEIHAVTESTQPGATDLWQGASLRDRAGDAQVAETDSAEVDSLDSIRREALQALEETRSLRDTLGSDPVADPDPKAPPPAPVYDYSPSVQPPAKSAEEDEDEHDEKPVQSRYARNSAKLPRLGIEPGSASSTIADLRRQINSDG